MNITIRFAYLILCAMFVPIGTLSADNSIPNDRLVKILKMGPIGIEQFNRWRHLNPIEEVNLRGADLRDTNLRGADLRLADLSNTKLRGAIFGLNLADELAKAEECRKGFAAQRRRGNGGMSGIGTAIQNLEIEVNMSVECENAFGILARVNKSAANLRGANLQGADLDGADFTGAVGCEEVFNAPENFADRCANPKLRSQGSQEPVALEGVDSGDLPSVLGREIHPTTTDEDGWSDLHYAAILNLPEFAKALLDAGASVDSQLENDGKRLSRQLTQSIRALGLDSDLGRKGYTPLHLAALRNARDVAVVLIARGAEVNRRAFSGVTPLHVAAERDASEVSSVLMSGGANKEEKSKQGLTPLHVAGAHNAVNVSIALIRHGASIDATDRRGRTPLHLAAGMNHVDVTKALLDLGANVKKTYSVDKTTVLHHAAISNAVDVIVPLVNSGADVRAITIAGDTPLHYAAYFGHLETARELVAVGADSNAQNRRGETPHQLAEQEGHRKVSALLKEL